MIKKIFISIIVFLAMVIPGLAANKFYWATGLTGGGAALDGIDGTGLTAGDTAAVMIDSGTNVPIIYFYRVQASSASEVAPNVIVPNANAGTSAWHLAGTQSSVLVNSDANGMSQAEMTAVGMYGTAFFATGAGTWNLPAAAAGMSFCVYSTTAATVIVNPDNADQIKPLTNAAGDGVTSASGAGDFICMIAIDATDWYVFGKSGAWTDSN
jgi:hypothetical protein